MSAMEPVGPLAGVAPATLTKQKETTAIKTILVLMPLKLGPGKLPATAPTLILFRLEIPAAAKPTLTR